jgi:hypothetical protein
MPIPRAVPLCQSRLRMHLISFGPTAQISCYIKCEFLDPALPLHS